MKPKYIVEKRKHLQCNVLIYLAGYMLNNENQSIINVLKSQVQVDQEPQYKNQSTESNKRENKKEP